ncbi:MULTISPECIES: hypothetical protein [unclassified Pseudomonas]|uniref:hypothetical protein n=1 Tax=unclassified Pseudomonas TaxID=196821 RepID=UPI0024491732|nr:MULTISPECIES: hypothetical protein [unclassified Pseudomonas]MDH0303999.1 hypothetical protein [Pseudomonas sp. GD04091]MDH1986152.1 hypothetical protein [Pseudomonas sp. GD03689]
MSSTTLKMEISWPASLAVPAGATVNAQLWVGSDTAFYRMISAGDCSAPADSSPTVLEISYDPQELTPDDASTTWGYFHTSPYLMHEGKRLNVERLAKIDIEQVNDGVWKVNLS